MPRFLVLVILCTLLVPASCRNKESDISRLHEDAPDYASFFTLKEHESGWIEARIQNPWDTTKLLQTVAMVPRSLHSVPTDIPQSATIVVIPLQKSLIHSTVHIGLLEELGAANTIGGVTDALYIKSASIQKGIKEGTIEDCGSWMAPALEKIIYLNPDAMLISPYQEGGTYGHLTELGLPIIYVADYMENHPLARAEWMKYYGLLFGKEREADSIFCQVEKEYNSIKHKAAETAISSGRKNVIMDLPFNGQWYVSGKGAMNDIFIEDAGGSNPLASVAEGKIVTVPKERVIKEAIDADVWVIRKNTPDTLSLVEMSSDYPFITAFKAYRDNEIWGCNLHTSNYYEETPFHPEKFLKDLFYILHQPSSSDSLSYFHKLN